MGLAPPLHPLPLPTHNTMHATTMTRMVPHQQHHHVYATSGSNNNMLIMMMAAQHFSIFSDFQLVLLITPYLFG